MKRPRRRRSAATAFDPAGIHAALLRAAREARRIAAEAGSPFYVWQDGAIVDLNAPASKRTRRDRTTSGTSR